ncbi:MAG: hypothetical protein ACOCQY_02950 [Halorhabdus sp.]
MRFRKVVIAAVILALCTTAGLAAYTIANDARAEAAQTTIERNDSLAVEPDINQTLTSDADHDPTGYADSITVTYNGSEWSEGDEYEYYKDEGEIEFLVDEDGEADVEYTYEIPEDQVADDQLQTLTGSYGQLIQVGAALSLIVVFLFVGGFAAKKLGVGGRPPRGR